MSTSLTKDGSSSPKVAPINRRVNMRKLRRQLFGKDRLPNNSSDISWLSVKLPDDYGNVIRAMDLVLKPRKPALKHPIMGRVFHSATQRLFAYCSCGRQIPVGRLVQHLHAVPNHSSK